MRTLKWLALVAAIFNFFYFSVWYSGSYAGRVVDERGKPVPGVVVVMAWTIKRYGTYPMLFKEAISNVDGEFEIPGWIAFSPAVFGHLANSPTIYFVKRGYMPSNARSLERRTALDATPNISSPGVIRALNAGLKQSDRQQLEYFVDGMCADLVLLLNPAFLDGANKFKDELREVFKELPSQYSKNQYREFSCVF